MIARNDEEVRNRAAGGLRRLYEAVPGLARPVAFRAFESHLVDLIAVATACLKGALDWPATLVGIETAYLQARACLDDDACGEVLEQATALVAQRAAADLDALSAMHEEADAEAAVMGVCSGPPETPMPDTPNPESTPGEPPGAEVAGSGVQSTGTGASEADAERPESASGTGFALSVSNSKANPKVQISYPKPKPNPKAKTEGRTA